MKKIINAKYEIAPCADLHGADLCDADLHDADLHDADLRNANLYGADLHDADLRNANLCDAKNIPPLIATQMLIVAEGELIGYKKLVGGSICKLRIPVNAKRSNATGRKCRAEFAVVLEGEGASQHDPNFIYKVGETVRPTESFCEDRWQECAAGIHFFLTREEAEAY